MTAGGQEEEGLGVRSRAGCNCGLDGRGVMSAVVTQCGCGAAGSWG